MLLSRSFAIPVPEDVLKVLLSFTIRVKNPTWEKGDWKHYLVPVTHNGFNKDGTKKPLRQEEMLNTFRSMHSEL
jgi:hypothetical protein